jgi:dTDP-4-amino-4,6-dideoxygalactose transaminase
MIEKRRAINNHYRLRLSHIPGIRLAAPPSDGVRYNYAYMPVEVDEDAFGLTRTQLYLKLRDYNVLARRYFYPIVPDFPCYRGMFAGADLPVARRVASRIITLPIYSDLALDDVDRICDMIEYFHSCACHEVALSASSQYLASPLTASVA